MDSRSGREHLDATGERKVVFCHHCENEWWQDVHGLICPTCEGEVTEVVEPDHDPREITAADLSSLRELHNHSWGGLIGGSDPEEADIEEHITRGPGNTIMIRQTIRNPPVRGPPGTRPETTRRRSSTLPQRGRDAADRDDPESMFMRTFQGLFGGGLPDGPTPRLAGHGIDDNLPGVWGPHFNPPRGPDLGRNRSGPNRGFAFHTQDGQNVFGGRVTFRGGPRTIGGGAGEPPINEITALLANVLGNMGIPAAGELPRDGALPRGGPGGHNLSALIAALVNPANAASGDAVYTQEALDRVISQLMEAHPTSSSAPGPAPPTTISSLPKKALTEQDLEGNKKVMGKDGVEEMKGECSVCMDDVGVGDEMVFLPCKHWFHEACASAWLSEHDSCPICRKSISPGGNSNSNSNNNGTNDSGSGSGGPGTGTRTRPFRRVSGGMGAGLGTNWGSNYPFNNPAGPASGSGSNAWGTTRGSIFTSSGRRERRERERQERDAERTAEEMMSIDVEDGSGTGGHSRWTSASAGNSTNSTSNEPSPWGTASRGSGGTGGFFGMNGRRGGDRVGSVSRRYSNYGRVAPQRRESDSERTRSTSPPEQPMPGAFSPTPPRRDSTRSSGSGSGSGSSGNGGGMLGWVRDRLPGSRRGDAA